MHVINTKILEITTKKRHFRELTVVHGLNRGSGHSIRLPVNGIEFNFEIKRSNYHRSYNIGNYFYLLICFLRADIAVFKSVVQNILFREQLLERSIDRN